MKKLSKIKNTLSENSKVAENYVFMTILQVLNTCFYLLIYPFLIRTLGAESYGLYAFAWSLVQIVIAFIGFGFDLPSARRVALAAQTDDKRALSRVVSCVQTSKCYLWFFAACAYGACLCAVPMMRANWLIFAFAFLETLTGILFPQWYYQGLQRMRVVTFIQFGFKLLSLPLIFWLISDPSDAALFMLISTASGVVGGLTAFLLIRYVDGVKQTWVGPADVREAIREALPFFLSNAMGILKERGIIVLIGAFLSMTDVALYDLANKIVLVPRTLFMKLNDALYPKIVVSGKKHEIRRILRLEALLGMAIIAVVALLGKWAVLLLGGEAMLPAYPVCLILSITILCWLLGTGYIDFVFIPSGQQHLVACNQLVALLSCALVAGLSIALAPTVGWMTAAISISGMAEVVFCYCITRKKQLL